MSDTRKSFTTRRGNRVFTVYAWTHPATGAKRWRFAWRRNAGEKWKYKTCETRAEVETEIDRITEDMDLGGLVWSALPPARRAFLSAVHEATPAGDEETVIAHLSSRGRSCEIGKAVGRFMAGKISAAGELSPYLGTVKRILDAMGENFKGRAVSDIHQEELAAWWAERTEGRGWKLRRDVRGYLVMFWRWCQREGLAGREPVTVAERLALVASEDMEKRVLTPAELAEVLSEVSEECRAWVVLGAFAGMRPEEAAAKKAARKGKRGLRREEIDWTFGVIRVPACVSKVRRPRIIPMCDALKAWLEWAGVRAGQTGPVLAEYPAGEISRLGEKLFASAWPKDALRHSYGSYRNAIVRSLEQVAEEMGTSVAMLHRHYHNPKAEAEGVDWFAVQPEPVPICSDQIGSGIVKYTSEAESKPLRLKGTA